MSATRVFVARLAGCAVFDPAGDRVGKVRDVLVVYRKNDPPRVVGLIVEIPGKRRVFVSIGRVTTREPTLEDAYVALVTDPTDAHSAHVVL